MLIQKFIEITNITSVEIYSSYWWRKYKIGYDVIYHKEVKFKINAQLFLNAIKFSSKHVHFEAQRSRKNSYDDWRQCLNLAWRYMNSLKRI